MAAPDVILMLEHYFQIRLDAGSQMRISNAINGGHGLPHLNLTPAQIEQLTAEHDSIDDMIVALEAKGKPPLPFALGPRSISEVSYDF